MAHYLDSLFDLGSYHPHPALDVEVDEATEFLTPADFGLDSTIFSDPGPVPTRTRGPAGLASSHSNYTHFPDLGQSIGGTATSGLGVSTSSTAFALLDPGSPYGGGSSGGGGVGAARSASPHPMRTFARDGRLKSKLMGVGHDGGFLTSPLIVAPPRVDSRTGRVAAPEIAIDSPVAPTGMGPQSSLMTPGNSYHGSAAAASATSDMTPSLSRGSSSAFLTGGEQSSTATTTLMSKTSSRSGAAVAAQQQREPVSSERTGLGMGIIGVPDLQVGDVYGGDDEGGDIDVEAMPTFGMRRSSTHGQRSYPTAMSTYGDEQPPLRHARSVTHVGAQTRFVDYEHVPPSPAAYAQAPPPPPPPANMRPTRAMPTRTLNKAKSCSALSISTRQQSRRGSNAYEPLTPTSAHQSAFPHDPHAPYTAPDLTISQIGNQGLLSFADLYNFDGAAGQQDGEANQFKQDMLDAAAVAQGEGLVVGLHGMTGVTGLLAEPYGPPSAASSPSTPYLSDPSPDQSHHYQGLDDVTSSAMLAASSVESAYSAHGGVPAAGRQRNAYPQAHPAHYAGEHELVESHMVVPQQQPRQRQASAAAAYGQGARNFSYPTRYPQQPQPQPQPPQFDQMHWAGSSQGLSHLVAPPMPPIPPMPPVPSTPRHREHPNPNHHRAHTGPAASRIVDASSWLPPPPMPQHMFVQDEYDRKLAQFDSLYDPAQGHGHGGHRREVTQSSKRGRDDDEDEYDCYDSFEPIPTSPELDAAGTRQKRLRSVASAPCLPSRRLRPGPRPKGSKSPAEQHQSVFSATLSPPVPHIRRGTSPFSSPLFSDDEDGRFPDRDGNGNPATAATITYVPGPPPLPGQPRSSVPRDVIQSLYSGIAGHTTPSGEKVGKRYVCLIEGCGRAFPRKSAIESHIQTHLEDKPFVCPHDDCGASFVRQHDLRRHERIHSDNKPFPCGCGKAFARGDALTRHRSRGICSGAAGGR
ncbi:hypothetical protein JCM8208_004823 [Rhodotorula glutinis]